jgi:hypothetical protein
MDTTILKCTECWNEKVYGEIDSSEHKDKVISLLYLLLRDKMSYGELEQLLRQNIEPVTADTVYANGLLLNIAQDLYWKFITK